MGLENRRELVFNVIEGHFCLSGALPCLWEMCLGAPNPSQPVAASLPCQPQMWAGQGRAQAGNDLQATVPTRALYSACSSVSHTEMFAP